MRGGFQGVADFGDSVTFGGAAPYGSAYHTILAASKAAQQKAVQNARTKVTATQLRSAGYSPRTAEIWSNSALTRAGVIGASPKAGALETVRAAAPQKVLPPEQRGPILRDAPAPQAQSQGQVGPGGEPGAGVASFFAPGPYNPQLPELVEDDDDSAGISWGRIAVGVAVIAALGGGGYFLYRRYRKGKKS